MEVQGHRLIALGSELAAIPVKALGSRVGSLAGKRTEIVLAIDIIISGV